MTLLILVISLALICLLLIGMPIAYAIGLIALVAGAVTLGDNFHLVAAQTMVNSLHSFVLIAAPFFMMAGLVMNSGGMTRRIFRFASALVGRLPGGLGQVSVFSSVLFAGMTGSALGEAVALGSMEVPAMRERGYDATRSAALVAASSTIGPILPPSVPFVIFAALAGASVGQLFLAGIVPGLLMGLMLMITVLIYARLGYFPTEAAPPRGELWAATVEAAPSLLLPLVVVVGIFTGFFTPTEAAIVAVSYSMALSWLYGELTLRALVRITVQVASATGALFLLVAVTAFLGWIVARTGVMINVALWFSSVSNPTTFMLLIVLLYLAVGLVMEPIPAMVLLVPILLPAVKVLQIDMVHFGVVTTLALMMGLIHPPVGLVMYAVARIANVRVDRLAVALVPFLIPLLIVLLICTVFPQVVLFVPRALQ